jgi:hypothetical protein
VTGLAEDIKNGLDESRTLVLGAQVLIGLLGRAVFEPRFDHLARGVQWLVVVALLALLVAFALAASPASDHQLAWSGQDTPPARYRLDRMLTLAPAPLALGLGLHGGLAVFLLAGRGAGLLAGLLTLGVAAGCWYALRLVRPRGDMPPASTEEPLARTPLDQRIVQVLTECRVVLPGVQALLGFQFATMLTEAFERLPRSSQVVHLISLLLMALSAVLLMTPAAYHRVVLRGENTEDLHQLASEVLLGGMAVLALGICAGLFVVARKVASDPLIAALLAVGLLLFFGGLWFGGPLRRRAATRQPRAG